MIDLVMKSLKKIELKILKMPLCIKSLGDMFFEFFKCDLHSTALFHCRAEIIEEGLNGLKKGLFAI